MWHTKFLLGVAVGLIATIPAAAAEGGDTPRLAFVTTVALDPMPSDAVARALRSNIGILLTITKELAVARSQENADATLRITRTLPATALIDTSPRYVQVISPTGEMLWSTAMPSDSPAESASAAKKIVDELIWAITRDAEDFAGTIDHDLATEPAK